MTEEEIKEVKDRLDEHERYVHDAWKAMRQEVRTLVDDKKEREQILHDVSDERGIGLNLTEFAKQHIEEFVAFCQKTV